MYPGIRAFRTGDFGRWNSDGELDFLGRADRQVKLNGNRVELGEVEAAMVAVPGVQATAVIVSNDSRGAPGLTAAYVSHPHLRESELRGALATSVPRYMIPAALLPVDAIPLTPHGKVDRAAILARAAAAHDRAWVPADEHEQLVARAWTEVIGVPPEAADVDLFAVGGHSLTVAMLVGRLCAEANVTITVRQVFTARTPRRLSELLRTRSRPADTLDLPMPWPAAPEPFSAGNHQRRMWFIEQYEEGDVRPYNMVEAFRIHGRYPPSALSAALDEVVRRHQVLRTVLRIDGDRIDQVILPPEEAGSHLQVIRAGESCADETVLGLLDAEQRRKFDLCAGPLLRAFWLTEDSAAGVLVLSVHHSACDGWSFAVILRDLLWFLDPQLGRRLPEPVQYGQYTEAMVARRGGEEEAAGREFWRQALARLPVVDLPLDRNRPMTRSSTAGVVQVSMGDESTARLGELCRQNGISWFTGMVGAVRVLLYRMCQARDIPLGCIVAGRNDSRLSDSVGMFANTLVLRTEVDPEQGFVDLVTAMGRHAEQVRLHDDFPFDTMVDEFAGERVAGRQPLFDVLVESVFSGIGQVAREASSLVEHLRLNSGASGFDLAFSLEEGGPSHPIEVFISYREDILDQETVQRMAGQLRHILGGLVADPQAPVGSVSFLPEEQREELLGVAVGVKTDMSPSRTLNELVQRQVSRRPETLALICGDKTLTYAEMDRLVSAQAQRLAAAARTGPGQVVALVCDRTEWLVIGLLAIGRTGSAFLSVDPDQPVARMSRLIADSGAGAVLASPEFGGILADCAVPVVSLGETPCEPRAHSAEFAEAGPRDLAYLVYTSGSTGVPKGVLVEHRAIVNSIQFRIGELGFGGKSRLLQVLPIHFDAGISDVFTALGSGASLVLITRDQLLDPGQVTTIFSGPQVTHACIPPAVYELLLDYAAPGLRSVRVISTGGDRLTKVLARRHAELLPDTALYNEYGPTEDAVITTVQRVGTGPSGTSIGRPIANKWVDLLDDGGELVPYGATGEICIGGAGLARGYHGDPVMTAQRFTANPSRQGARMYRTGDLGRWLPGGCLEYIGRKDDQVKIRGRRVEPGEAAAVLAAAPGVERVAVIAAPGPDQEMGLVAYVIGPASESSLNAFARDRLPGYMVPGCYVYLTALPLTPTGKLDRNALPAPSHTPGRDEPRLLSPAEQRIADIWSAVLQKPVTDPDAALFEIGGHSLAAARIAHELDVSVVTVFANQTVRALAAATADRVRPPVAAVVPAVREPSAVVPLAPSQRRVWVTSSRLSADVYVHSDLVRTGRRIDATAFRRALMAVVERQEILRAQVRARGGAAELMVLDRLPNGVPLVVVDLPGADPDGPETTAEIAVARAVLFDLEQAPLFAIRLITGLTGGDLIVITGHHLIFDAASTPILLDDLFTAYDRAISGKQCDLPPLSYTYRDWIIEEQEWLAGEDAQAQERFWLERMAHVGELPDPVGARRGAHRGRRRVASFELSGDVIAPGSGTPFAVAVTAFAVMLYRATHAHDLVLGFAASLRHRPEADAVVGFMANVMPLRLEIAAETGLRDVLSHATERIAEAYAHSRLPFDVLADKLSLRARPGGSVLLDLGVTLGNANVQDKTYVIDDVLTPGVPATSDLWLFISLVGAQLRLDLTYDDALIDAGEADSLISQIAGLMREVGSGANVPLDDRPGQDRVRAWERTHYEF
jgi:amino acid adenylation domain-containing protein